MNRPPSASSPDAGNSSLPDEPRLLPQHSSGHERSDASLRVIGWAAGSLALGVAAALVVALALFWGRGSLQPPARTAPAGRFQNGPEARTSVEQDRLQLQKETIARLSTYGWIDRPAGVVRIPIERAMALEAERQAGRKKP